MEAIKDKMITAVPDEDLAKAMAEYDESDRNKIRSIKARFTDGGEKKLPEVVCARILKMQFNFHLIGTDGKAPLGVYVEKQGIYTTDELYLQRLVYREESKYTEKQVNDVLFKLKMTVSAKKPENDPNLIPVANGIYNVKEKRLEPFTPEKIFTSKISTKYVENAPKPAWDVDKWLLSLACGDQNVATLLWQIINESLNGNYTRGKYFLLVGDGNNGKGTYQQLLINLIGEENVSTLRIKQINDRFSPSVMVGKVANIGDDIDGEYIANNENVQSIATGDTITVEEKRKQPYSVTLKLAMIFSANKIPKIGNRTEGTYRRMVIVPFNANFNGQVEDKSIKEEKIKDQTVLEYVLHRALNIQFDRFIEPTAVKRMLDEYRMSNDPVLEFYQNEWLQSEFSNYTSVPTQFVFDMYSIYAERNGYSRKSLASFTKEFSDKIKAERRKDYYRPSADFIHAYSENRRNNTEPRKLYSDKVTNQKNPKQCYILK